MAVLAAALAVSTPRVQDKVADFALDKLKSAIDGRVEVGSIKLLPFNALQIKDLAIIDEHPYTEDEFQRGWQPDDTLFRASGIYVSFTLKTLLAGKGLHMGRVLVDNGYFHLITEPAADGKPVCNLQRIFRLPESQDTLAVAGPDIFDIRKVRVDNFRFRLNSFCRQAYKPSGHGIYYDDLDVTTTVRAHNMKFTGGRMHGKCDFCSAVEKSGYVLDNLTGDCVVGMGQTMVRNLHLTDPYSDFRMKYYSMTYRNARSFAKYISDVLMEGEWESGRLGIQTISYFSGALAEVKNQLDIESFHTKGYVNDFMLENFKFKECSSGISGKVDGTCTGLPQVDMMRVDVNVRDLDFTVPELMKAIAQSAPSVKLQKNGKINLNNRFRLDTKASGTLNKLRVDASIRSREGKASLKADVRNLLRTDAPTEITTTAGARDLNVGAFLGTDLIAQVTMETGIRAKLDGDRSSIIVDSLRVDRLNALGYDYNGIAAAGKFTSKTFDGRLICTDPNLNFLFQGIVGLPGQNRDAQYKFYANLGYADLAAIGLDTRGGASKASCQLNANFRSVVGEDIIGDIAVRNLHLENDEGSHEIGDISIGSHFSDGLQRIQFSSSFADGGYVGEKSILRLIDDIQEITTRRHLPSLYKVQKENTAPGSCELSFDFHDTRDILSFALPGLFIADGTSMAMGIDRAGSITGSVHSAFLAFEDKYMKGFDLDFDNLENSLNCTMASDEVCVGGVGFRNSALSAYSEHDDVSLSFHYDGMTQVDNTGEIYVNADFARDSNDSLTVRAHMLPSYFRMDKDLWELGASEIALSGDAVSVDGFQLSNGDQSLSINGGISRSQADTLGVNISNIDIALANRILDADLGLGGTMGGRARLISPMDGELGLALNILCDSLELGGRDAGQLLVQSDWDDDAGRLNVRLGQILNGRRTLGAEGWINPAEKNMNADMYMDGLDLSMAEPFLKNIFSAMSGRLDGKISVGGSLDSPDISSSGLRLDNATAKVAFTGVPYTLNGPMRLDNNGLWFDSISITDGLRGNGSLNGALRFDRLKDISLDAGVMMEDMLAVSMAQSGNKGIYGNLTIDGRATVSGPLNSLMLDADIITDGDGSLNVPLGSSAIATRSDLLTFKEREKEADPFEQYEQTRSKAARTTKGDFSAHAKVTVTPGISTSVELGGDTGSIVTATGSGSITMDLRPSKDIFNLDGDYSIQNGSVHFELPGIVSRDFSVRDGSSIKFGGDIMESEVDITAIHNLKTTLSTLLADTTAVSTRRAVECGITISDKLRNPKLGFSIDVPDLDPTTKAQVESALNTDDKVQKQFIALLLFGTFLPSENSGIVNGNNVIYSNVSEIMASQLNSILQKLEIPLDLGFGYQQNEGGTDIFDVAVSTQLFNNRVVVNGTVGNRKYSTSKTAGGDMVGDLDIEVKLDKPGQFRLNLFSHSADEYTSYLDYSQRNGVGIAYQKEFSTFRELLKSMFSGKKEKQQFEKEVEMETIRIEK